MTKEELLDFCTIEGKTIRFNMSVDFDDLLGTYKGMEGMNSLVEDFVEDGHLLEDISYSLEGCEGDNLHVLVEADGSMLFEE